MPLVSRCRGVEVTLEFDPRRGCERLTNYGVRFCSIILASLTYPPVLRLGKAEMISVGICSGLLVSYMSLQACLKAACFLAHYVTSTTTKISKAVLNSSGHHSSKSRSNLRCTTACALIYQYRPKSPSNYATHHLASDRPYPSTPV